MLQLIRVIQMCKWTHYVYNDTKQEFQSNVINYWFQTVSTAQELRRPVYRSVASRVIDYEQVGETTWVLIMPCLFCFQLFPVFNLTVLGVKWILCLFQTLQLMTGVRWDIRDIMSQHNAYVDILVRVIK